MRQSIIIIIVAVVFVPAAFAQMGKITVVISGVEKIEGQLAIGLYNKSSGFPEISKAYKGVFLDITKKDIQYVFSNIPNGNYAIAVFHDKNKNGKHDKNFFGIPKEGYGFSNNAPSTFGPPNFEKAAFNIGGNYAVNIKIKY